MTARNLTVLLRWTQQVCVPTHPTVSSWKKRDAKIDLQLLAPGNSERMLPLFKTFCLRVNSALPWTPKTLTKYLAMLKNYHWGLFRQDEEDGGIKHWVTQLKSASGALKTSFKYPARFQMQQFLRKCDIVKPILSEMSGSIGAGMINTLLAYLGGSFRRRQVIAKPVVQFSVFYYHSFLSNTNCSFIFPSINPVKQV